MTSIWIQLGQLVADWNMILVVIALCSVIGVAVFIERLAYLRRVDKDTTRLLLQLRPAIQDGNIAAALEICQGTGGAVANIIRAGLSNHERSREDIMKAMQLRGIVEIALLEKHARILSVLAHVTPLIGLLGTVLGFIRAFGEMRMSSLVEISTNQIGEAMEFALVTTAAGLVVAIPAVIAYNLLVSRIESVTVDMQAGASEVIDLISEPHEGSRCVSRRG